MADQLRERLIRRIATLATFAARPVCEEALQSSYDGECAEDLEQIAEGWRSVLRDSFAVRLKAVKQSALPTGRRS